MAKYDAVRAHWMRTMSKLFRIGISDNIRNGCGSTNTFNVPITSMEGGEHLVETVAAALGASKVVANSGAFEAQRKVFYEYKGKKLSLTIGLHPDQFGQATIFSPSEVK